MAPKTIPSARKPSKVVKPKKSPKRTTSTANRHRFQPFSERISKLKIDPVRRRRRADDQEELSSQTATYFGTSLEEWRDLNLSQTFGSFVKEAAPLCDSLVTVIYNEERLMDLLVSYIDRSDGLALEPLLSLLSHFAHDLDSRFDKHFHRAVTTITALAARHSDPAVVEWSFTCLAWLFKFLSRLLVPDLRPLYDIMASYLGRDHQKPYVIRFAAESMSFLVRKAAVLYQRDAAPLDNIVGHICNECRQAADTSSTDLYRQGIMTLLTESIKGVQGELHSSASAVLQSLFQSFNQPEDAGGVLTEIVKGSLTSIIHHAYADKFGPVQEAIVKSIHELPRFTMPGQISFAGQLLFTIAVVRKGSRILDWKPVIQCVQDLLEAQEQLSEFAEDSARSLLAATAVIMQTATIDAVLPALKVFEALRQGRWQPFFLQFCDLYARLGHERFQDFLLPHFKKFVIELHQGNEDSIFRLLPALLGPARDTKMTCPEQMQNEVVRRLRIVAEQPEHSDVVERVASANLALDAASHLHLNAEASRDISTTQISLIKYSLASQSSKRSVIVDFALGNCLHSLLENGDRVEDLTELWSALCMESNRFVTLKEFWSNMLRYCQIHSASASSSEQSRIDDLTASLVKCLSLPSHDIRLSALEILRTIYVHRQLPVPHLLDSALAIESTPVSIDTTRHISMNIRSLGRSYSESKSDPLMQQAIPTYCFGLLHVRLSQAWEDACVALEQMASTPAAEDVIIKLAQEWTKNAPTKLSAIEGHEPRIVLDNDSQGFRVLSDFECPNLAKVSAIYQQTFGSLECGRPSATQQFQEDHARVPEIAQNAREQALKVLTKAHRIAEKHSRMLVPILLDWAGAVDTATGEDHQLTSNRWTRKDQKAMLGIFSQFTNPKMLYKSNEVYFALLNLCANGDVEIQRAALKAIFAWKEPAVNKYEEHLTNFLDEARFREEVSSFLQASDDSESQAMLNEHQSKLMPVLLRILYGRAIAGGKGGHDSRRKAIFVALSRYDSAVLELFLDISLGPLASLQATDGQQVDVNTLAEVKMAPRQQLGMVNMLGDMLDTLGPAMEPFCMQLFNALLVCTVSASRQLENGNDSEPSDASLLRSIRQNGVQCLATIFAIMQSPDIDKYALITLQELILPRLAKFAVENTQSISGSMRLISAFASVPATQTSLAAFNGRIMDSVAVLLREAASKDEVRLFILQDVLDKLLQAGSEGVLEAIHINSFARSIGEVIASNPSKAALDACVTSLTLLAEQVRDKTVADAIVNVSSDLLARPGQIVSPRTKAGLLRTLLPVLDHADNSSDDKLYDAVCGLFSRLNDPTSRMLLVEVLTRLSQNNKELSQSAEICREMNSFGGISGEPDFEKREAGFAKIYKQYETFSQKQWLPIVHNCLFYIRDEEDLVNRTSASRALERFIDSTASDAASRTSLASTVLLPGLVFGMKRPSELVRAEYLRLLGHLTDRFQDWSAVKDMRSLTLDADDEASFFTNVLHIQQHRRLRALRRLSDEAVNISSHNVTQIFVPLLEHFVFDQAEGDAGRTLADQSILTLGALARALNWSSFRASFRRYVTFLKSEDKDEKVVLRLLGVFVDALESILSKADRTKSPEEHAKKTESITTEFLPPLAGYLHHKDESTIDRRMPVAVSTVRLLLLLPQEETATRLPAILTDVSQVLRSRSQEARDQARKALSDIFALVGPSYLTFILKELRSALQRGYQLHVLSFTVHSLLVNHIKSYQAGDLDDCLPELVAIVLDDTFGVTGQEKDAEEYKSGMKEVKSSKSFDTMELLASVTSVQKVGRLLQPIQALLSERLDAKAAKKIEDLLHRVRRGIDQNPAAGSRDMLTLCHEIVRSVRVDQPKPRTVDKKLDKPVNRYIIQPEPGNQKKVRHGATSQAFKLVSFAFDLLRKVLRRHEDLMTPANLSGFLPIVGDAIVQGEENVQLSALKLLGAIMKVPIPELEANAPVYVKEAVRIIRGAPSMTAESARAGLELITAVLREKRSAHVAEKDVAHILKALKNDLDEPDQQNIVYRFLRAVLGRKVMITEVYEIMDEVGKVMVTNADQSVREGARSVYLQFILEYPQGKDRSNKQSGFLVENLKYKHAAGRQSVMELINQLLTRLPDEIFDQLAFTLFVALVPVQVGDSDASCQQMAALLIHKIFERAGGDMMSTFLGLVDKWLGNGTNPTIQIAALKCWMILLKASTPSKKNLESFRDGLDSLLDAHSSEDSTSDGGRARQALQAFEVLIEFAPQIAFEKGSAGIWDGLIALLANIESSLEAKETAAKLLGTYFGHLASASSKSGAGLSKLPLRGADGLEMDADEMRKICHSSLRILRSGFDKSSEELRNYTVRNLVFLGRCFAADGMVWREESQEDSDKDSADELAEKKDPSALAYLSNRLSYIIRQETYPVESRTASLQCQTVLINTIDAIPNLQSVLRPLYSLTDASIPRPSDEATKKLVDKARELMDIVQKKVGAENYIRALGVVRADAKERREDRRQKRRIDAVSAPERAAKEKRKKHEARKDKLKARGLEARGKRRAW